MISTSYAITREDFYAFSEHLVKRRYGRFFWFVRHGAPMFILLLGTIFAVLLLWLWRSGATTPLSPLALVTIATVVVISYFSWPLWNAFNWSQMRRAPHFGQPTTIELREEGVHLRTSAGEALLFWSNVESVHRSQHHLFLYVSSRSALIIPDKAFNMPADVMRFCDFAQNQWQLAHLKSAPVPIASPH